MNLTRERFEQMLTKYDTPTQKVYAAIKGLQQQYDYNAGDKSLTQLAIYPTESVEITTRENWSFINIIYYSSSLDSDESINRNVMRDKPQFILTVDKLSKEMSVTPYHGCDDIESKARTLKEMLSDIFGMK